MDSHSPAKKLTVEFPGLIRVYDDGSVERLWNSPYLPPSPEDPVTGVASKDVIISESTGLSARLYLPKLTDKVNNKLPILVYFHGGGFLVESAFSTFTHPYMNRLASEAQVLIISVEYRLAPEHPLPTAYDDCWDALNWAASQPEPWLTNHGDITALFIGGDSSGANIVHNIAIKAGTESLKHGVKILGAFLSQGLVLDEKSEALDMAYKIWDFVYPDAPGGSESPMINPMAAGAPTLAGLGCCRVLVVVAGKDVMKGSGIRYYKAVKASGFGGRVALFEVEGEDHGFHVSNPEAEKAKFLFQRLGSFLSK